MKDMGCYSGLNATDSNTKTQINPCIKQMITCDNITIMVEKFQVVSHTVSHLVKYRQLISK